MNVYINSDVATAVQLYTGLCYPIPQLTIKEFLQQAAEQLYEAHWSDNPSAAVLIKNWHPELIGLSDEAIMQTPFAYTDAQITVAREHGFKSWSEVERLGKKRFDQAFETAVDAVVSGDLLLLRALLSQHPQLVQQQSRFGHQATLLHYVAANGVETYRQQVPLNVVEIAHTLLQAGADPAAEMRVYGGRFTVHDLVESSGHPDRAGVQNKLLTLLKNTADRP